MGNDPVHYHSASFQRSYQQPWSAGELNGWFSPGGSGDWRLTDCVVTAAFPANGTPARNGDPVRAAIVAGVEDLAPGQRECLLLMAPVARSPVALRPG